MGLGFLGSWGLGFRVTGFRVWGLGFRVWGLGFWVLGVKVPPNWFKNSKIHRSS